MIKSAAQSSILNDTRYTSMSAGVVPSSEYLIESRVLDSTTPSITFDNLGQYSGVYRHLYLVSSARGTRSSTEDAMLLRFNGDSATNYSTHWMEARGSSVTSGAVASYSAVIIDVIPCATFSANAFSASMTDILDAFSTVKNKTVRSLCGAALPIVSLQSGFWRNTTAITSITVLAASGSLVAGSRFSLYGVTA
jgi:hypothetical protein